MITVKNATLRVKRVKGRNGPFGIADLSTDFGQFKVKDSILDQFEEGSYEVTAWIEEIYMGQYVAYGKAITEIRARLRDLQVLTEDQQPAPEEPIEPDPIEEEGSSVPEPVTPELTAPERDKRWDKFKKPKEEVAPAPAADESADDLFDDETWGAIERAMPIKLDASVERALLRRQTTALKERGYRFDAKQQTWLFAS